MIFPEDDFIHTKAYREYKEFRVLNESLSKSISAGEKIPEEELTKLIGLNPYYWKVYVLAGDYYFQQKNYKKAIIYYKQAQSREVTTLLDERDLEKMISKSYRKL